VIISVNNDVAVWRIDGQMEGAVNPSKEA